MSLAIALQQIQLPPQYHPSYKDEVVRVSVGRPKSELATKRRKQLYEIVLRIGPSIVSEIMVEMRKVDKKLHQDDARKYLNELVELRKMDKRVIYSPVKRAIYTARYENG